MKRERGTTQQRTFTRLDDVERTTEFAVSKHPERDTSPGDKHEEPREKPGSQIKRSLISDVRRRVECQSSAKSACHVRRETEEMGR